MILSYYDLPEDLSQLPSIELNNSKAKVLSSSFDEVVEIGSDTIQEVFNNRK